MLIRYWRPLVAFLLVAAGVLLVGLSRYHAGFAEADAQWKSRWAQRDARDALSLEQAQREARAEERRRQGTIVNATIFDRFSPFLMSAIHQPG